MFRPGGDVVIDGVARRVIVYEEIAYVAGMRMGPWV